MTEEMRKEYALMRYGIIAPVVCHMLPEGKTKKEFFEDSLYKTGADEIIRSKARKEYLDAIGLLDSFRWSEKQDVNVTHSDANIF